MGSDSSSEHPPLDFKEFPNFYGKVSKFYNEYKNRNEGQRTELWDKAIKNGAGEHLITWKWRVKFNVFPKQLDPCMREFIPSLYDGFDCTEFSKEQKEEQGQCIKNLKESKLCTNYSQEEKIKCESGYYTPIITENLTYGHKLVSILSYAIEEWDMVLLNRLLDINSPELIKELTTPLYTMILFMGTSEYNYVAGRTPINMILNRLSGFDENPDEKAVKVMERIGALLNPTLLEEQFKSCETVVFRYIGISPSRYFSLENGYCYSQEDIPKPEKINLQRFNIKGTGHEVSLYIPDKQKIGTKTLTSFFYPEKEHWSQPHVCTSCGRQKRVSRR